MEKPRRASPILLENIYYKYDNKKKGVINMLKFLKVPALFKAAQKLRDEYDARVSLGIDDHMTHILDWAWLKATKEIIDIGGSMVPKGEEIDWICEMYEIKKIEYKIYDLAADMAIKNAMA